MSQNGYDIGKIEEMAERARRNEPHDSKRTTDAGGVEYSFTEGLPKTSLVFLDGEEQDTPAEADADAVANGAESGTDDAAAEDAEHTVTRTPDAEEFDIPDMFVVSDEYSQTVNDGMIPTVWRTYVPRFTEITERPIKMRSDTNSAPLQKPTEAAPDVRIDRVTGGDSDDPAIRESEVSTSAVIVNVDGQDGVRMGDDKLNLYKFGREERPPAVVLSEEEAARREVTELTGHVFTDEELALGEPVAEQAPPTAKSISTEASVPSRRSADEVRREREPAPQPVELNEAYTARDEDELAPEQRPLGWDTDLSKIDVSKRQDYHDHSQREQFKDRFLDASLAVKIRLVIGALLTLLALAFEGALLFGVNPLSPIMLEGYPAAFPLIDAILVVALFLVALPEAIRSLREVAYGRVIPELMLPILAITLIAYNTVIAKKLPVDYPTLAFAYGIFAVSAIYATYCLHNANFESFKIVSSRGNKSVIDIRLTRSFERENLALDGRVDEFKSRFGRPFRCAFASDLDKRSENNTEGYSGNLTVLLLTLGIATVSGLVMYFIDDGLVSLLATFSLVVMIGLPAFSALSHKLPYLHLQREAALSDLAVIGEGSLRELSSVDCFAFNDTEVFGGDDVSFKSISLSGIEGDFRSAMRLLASLFASLGGPLEELFFRSLGKRVSPSTETVVESDGAMGKVLGSTVMAGTREYLERHGVIVAPEREAFLGGMRIMYAAKDGELFAKINVQYNFSEDFARALSYMKAHGVVPLIYSRDPNLDNELLRFLTGGADIIRVMKRTVPAPEREVVYRRLSSPAVSRGGRSDMLEAVFLAKRYSTLEGQLSLTELSAAAVGSTLAAVIAVSGLTSGLPTVLVGAWQLLWCLALSVISRKSFKRQRNKNTRKK